MPRYTVTPIFGAFEDKPVAGMKAQVTMESDNIEEMLEKCFVMMQNGTPMTMKDYHTFGYRSLSCGDILTVCEHCENGAKEMHDWIVASFGFRRLDASEARKWQTADSLERSFKMAR